MVVINKVVEVGKNYIIFEDVYGHRYYNKGGSVAWRCNNPGNLKHGAFAIARGSLGKDTKGHAIFPTVDHGRQAHYDLLFSPESKYYKLTIEQAISRYAPEYDGNDTEGYIRFVCKNVNVPRTTILSDLTETQKNSMLTTMQKMEGYIVGEHKLIEG